MTQILTKENVLNAEWSLTKRKNEEVICLMMLNGFSVHVYNLRIFFELPELDYKPYNSNYQSDLELEIENEMNSIKGEVWFKERYNLEVNL